MGNFIRVLAFLVCFMVSSPSFANYAMDPIRKPDPAFAKFFLNRIDSWLRFNIFDYRLKMSVVDRQFVDAYLAAPRSLGESKDAGFIRNYSYGFHINEGRVTYGPFRFVHATPSTADREMFAKVLRSRKIAVPENLTGVGFTADTSELEVITEAAKDSQVILLYRAGKQVSQSTIERGVKAQAACPVSPWNEQVDRVKDSEGQHFQFHSTTAEDDAFSMEGRQLVHKIQLGLELSPGLIDYHSQTRYGLAYP